MANPPFVSDKAPNLNGRRNGGSPDSSASSHASLDAADGARLDQAARFNLRKFRPLGVADMFDEAFDLYKNNFRLMLFSTAIVQVPLFVLLMVFFNPLTKQMTQLANEGFSNLDPYLDLLTKTIWDTTLASLVYSFATVLTFGAVGYIASQRYLGRPVTFLEAYALSARRLLVLGLGTVLASLFGSLWMIACVLGVLIPMCRFSILPQVAVLEKHGIYGTVVRCWKMTSSAYWRLAMVLTMLFVVDLVLRYSMMYSIQFIAQYVVGQLLPAYSAEYASLTQTVNTVVEGGVGILIAPFGIAVMTIAYYDIRIRDEGFDMAILNEILDNGSADDKAWTPDYKVKPIRKPIKNQVRAR